MEQCAGCHWHCTGKRICKSVQPINGNIDLTLFEDGLFSMPGIFQTLPTPCTSLKSESSQSATAWWYDRIQIIYPNAISKYKMELSTRYYLRLNWMINAFIIYNGFNTQMLNLQYCLFVNQYYKRVIVTSDNGGKNSPFWLSKILHFKIFSEITKYCNQMLEMEEWIRDLHARVMKIGTCTRAECRWEGEVS